MRTRFSILCVFVLVLTVVPLSPVIAEPPELVIVVGLVPEEPLRAELDAFTATVGVPVVYEELVGSADISPLEELMLRIDDPEPPDVIVIPQWWFLSEIEDRLVDLSEFVKTKKLKKSFGDYLIDAVTAGEGAVLGAPVNLSLKTLVWYKPAEFTAAGYTVPETFADLVTLSDRIVADPETGSPWCNYIWSGPVCPECTGWLGTDWIEDLLLGAEGGDVYDGWVDHSVPFTSTPVETGFERYQEMIDSPGYVYDRPNMLNVSFGDNVWPLHDGDCLMHRQATFLRNFIPSDISGEFSTFKFPSVSAEFADAAMGGLDTVVAALNDRKEVGKLIKFMLSAEFGRTALAASGDWLLPHRGFDHSLYPNDLVRSWADIIRAAIKADLFRFDGSDLMPPEVGSGTFWTGIVDLVEGEDIPTVLADIDVSWPE